MAFVIKNPPEFTLEVEEWDRTTKADGAEMAKAIEKLLNNEFYNKTETKRQDHVELVMLPAAGWTGEAPPYRQTVPLSGAEEGLAPLVVSAFEDTGKPEDQRRYMKAFGIICQGTAEITDGSATFNVYKKPTTDCTIGLRGV